jgi:uncharacterized protein HemY
MAWKLGVRLALFFRGKYRNLRHLGKKAMTTVCELHDRATELTQMALVARHEGRIEEATDLVRQAAEYETQAARLIPDDKSSEPTRSILYLSAASLAYQIKDLQTAQRLVAEGLSGYPSPKAERDFRDLAVLLQNRNGRYK